MKKATAILLALALALLCAACGSGSEAETTTAAHETTAASSTEPTTAYVPATVVETEPWPAPDPNRKMAVMEPLQGGEMLYAFEGSKAYKTVDHGEGPYPCYYFGLIDQDGKLVSKPVYESVEYIYAENGRQIIGLIARKGQDFTLYELSGKSRKLACKGYEMDVYPGGRYATVETIDYVESGHKFWDGLFDLSNDCYVVEPKDGQLIQYNTAGMVFWYQYKAGSNDNEQMVSQRVFNCADESVREIPLSIGRVQEYYPETGWFGTYGDYNCYDKDLNPLPNLNDWIFHHEGFGGGEYCRLYNGNNFSWVNRKGEVVDNPMGIEVMGREGHCYFTSNSSTGKVTMFDPNLNVICEVGPDEYFETMKSQIRGGYEVVDAFFLVESNENKVKKAFNTYGKPFAKIVGFRSWLYHDTIAYAVKDDNFRMLDLHPLAPPEPNEDGWDGYAIALAVGEEYIVARTGWWATYDSVIVETFAVDWDGNPYPDCPLEPYYKSLHSMNTAGEQGPNYYWVEAPDGQRGYIDAKGNWLFVDKTGM